MFGRLSTLANALPALNLTRNITKVSIIGAGVMGSGIAQACALANHHVLIYDISPEFHEVSKYKINKSLEKYISSQNNNVKKAKERVSANITYTTDLQSTFDNAELAIETIFENLAAKQKLFANIEQYADPKTIFATNSQTLKVHEIAKDSPRKDRFMGVHFFYPSYKNKKVELVKLPETSDETFNQVKDWIESLGKTAYLVQKRSSE